MIGKNVLEKTPYLIFVPGLLFVSNLLRIPEKVEAVFHLKTSHQIPDPETQSVLLF